MPTTANTRFDAQSTCSCVCEKCKCNDLIKHLFSTPAQRQRSFEGCSCSCSSNRCENDGCFTQTINSIYNFTVTFVSESVEHVMEEVKNMDVAYGLVPHDFHRYDLFMSGKVSMKHMLSMLVNYDCLIESCSSQLVSIMQVEPMRCMNCVNAISNKLHESFVQLPHHIECSLQKKLVYVYSDVNQSISASECSNILVQMGKTVTIVFDSSERPIEELVQPQTLAHRFHLTVNNLKCGSCVKKVTDKLSQISGVSQIELNKDTKQCSLIYEHSDSDVMLAGERIIDALNNLGFPTTISSYESVQTGNFIEMTVSGMKCSGCSSKIKRVLLEKYGRNAIEDVLVNLAEKRVTVMNSKISQSQIEADITEMGFSVVQPDTMQSEAIEILEEVPLDIVIHKPSNKQSTTLLAVEGMTCGSCVSKVESHMLKLNGVTSCSVNLITQKAEITYDPAILSESDLISEIISLGFSSYSLSSLISQSGRVTLWIEDLVQFEDRISMFLEGYIDSSIAEGNKLIVEYNPDKICPRNIMDILQKASISATLYKESSFDMKASILRTHEIKYWKRLFMVSAVLTIPAMIIAMVLANISFFKPMINKQIVTGLTVEALVMAILVTPVQFYCGWPFFKLAFQALRHKSADMNVLIAIATTEAYAYSIFAVIYSMIYTKRDATSPAMGHHYFETAASLIMFLLLGRWMENVAKGRTSSALVALMDLQPSVAVLLENSEDPLSHVDLDVYINNSSLINEREIDVDLVTGGDLLKVVPGTKIPVDGVVVHGTSTVDESMITGESLPVFKAVDSKVIGGSINSCDGLLVIRATKVGADSTLQSIAKLVEQSQMKKPKLQSLADKISFYFVPMVVCLSIITFAVWFLLGSLNAYPASWRPMGMSNFVFSLLLSMATVIIACPCSLGLATPTAVMTGTGVAARNGILIKGGQALESVSKCTAVLFDKTGTLTKGELTVTEFRLFDSKYEDRSLFAELCASVHEIEKSSEHPIARAVCEFAKDHRRSSIVEQSPQNFINVPGRGVSATIGTSQICIGNEAFMRDQNVQSSTSHDYNKHSTIVFVAVNSTLTMTLLLSDTVREESKAVVATLKSMKHKRANLKVFMLTGDNQFAAQHIAQQVGIEPENVFSQLTPGGKSDKVKELQMLGETVLMVGDGINDSPSLTQADASIAVGAGTDVAIECADIVLMQDNIEGIVTAIDLSKTIYRRIIMNFIWAFGYNVLAIPLAAGVFYPLLKIMIPPWVAGLAMVLSSISVTLSSLLLNIYRKPKLVRVEDEGCDLRIVK